MRKFYGKGDFFIKAISDTTIDNIEYKTGDIVSFFENVDIELLYELTHKQSTSTNRESSFVQTEPSIVNVSGVENTKELDKLYFSNLEETQEVFNIVERHELAGKKVFLRSNLIPAKIEVYANGEKIKYSYDDQSNSVEFDETQSVVDIILTIEASARNISLKGNDLGYLRLEATVTGYFGKKEGYFKLNVPVARLVSEPETAVTSVSSYKTQLSFAVVGNTREEVKLSFINE